MTASAYVFLASFAVFALLTVTLIAFRICSFRACISFASSLVAARADSAFPCCTEVACSSSSLVAVSAVASFPSASFKASWKAFMPWEIQYSYLAF